jgi:hypothetical protein
MWLARRFSQNRKENMTMETSLQQEITRILTDFAATKFAAQVLEVKGPVQEGSSYRWRIVSNRYKEVTVMVSAKKSLFGKSSLSSIEVYGLGETVTLKPNLQDLQDYLDKAELAPVR